MIVGCCHKKGLIMQFKELNLSQELIMAVDELGFQEMTEIQEKSIPLLLEKADVIGRSNTGTGKTLSKVSLFGKFIEKPPLPLSRNPMYH